jgi:hypothetical protein
MDRQIGPRYQEPSVMTLADRVSVLETRVAMLSEVIRVLAHGLEDFPIAEPGQRLAADAARRAYELLLAAEPRTQGAGSSPGAAAT